MMWGLIFSDVGLDIRRKASTTLITRCAVLSPFLATWMMELGREVHTAELPYLFPYFLTELPEQAVKGIFRFLSSTIGRYQDAGSRRATYKLVAAVVRAFPESSVKNVVAALSSFADSCKKRCAPW